MERALDTWGSSARTQLDPRALSNPHCLVTVSRGEGRWFYVPKITNIFMKEVQNQSGNKHLSRFPPFYMQSC